MGLLHKSTTATTVVLLKAEGAIPRNIEDLAHPILRARSPRHAVVFRVSVAALLAGWLGFLVAASRSTDSYTNGYIELATMIVSALGEFVMQNVVVRAMHVETVYKTNAITVIAWLAHHHYLHPSGVPANLLVLNGRETELVRTLYAQAPPDRL